MNIKQLKAQIADLPEDMEVYVFDPEQEFECVPIERSEVVDVEFREDSSTPNPMATDRGLVFHFS